MTAGITGPVEIPELRTERLVLRGWREGDLEPFAALNADPVVMAHFQGTLSRDESDWFVLLVEQCWRERGWGLWAVDVIGGAPFIGYVGLWPADHVDGTPQVEVGWRLAAEHWGHGYAPEAARAAVTYGFEVLGLDEIVSFTVPQNRASWRVMERLGMRRRPERDFDHARVDPVRYPQLVRHVFYALARSDHRPLEGDTAAR